MIEPLLTVQQVAEILGVHENWVYGKAASGEIASYRVGSKRRFRETDIEAWLERQRITPTPIRRLRFNG